MYSLEEKIRRPKTENKYDTSEDDDICGSYYSPFFMARNVFRITVYMFAISAV